MRAKKFLGQHFLTSEPAVHRIINAAEIREGETVIEIGPGKGVLTDALLDAGARVTAVEKDEGLASDLRNRFAEAVDQGSLTIRTADILDEDFSTIAGNAPYKIVANIPYNITGRLIRCILTAHHQPNRAVLLLQKEVLERILARNGKEGLLSLSVKAYGEPCSAGVVKAGSFAPPPKVDSGILVIENISRAFFTNTDEDLFFDILRAGFNQKRKQLRPKLSHTFHIPDDLFTQCDIPHTARAEELRLEDWRCLHQSLARLQR